MPIMLVLTFGTYRQFIFEFTLKSRVKLAKFFQEHSFNYDPNSTEALEVNHDVLFREGTHNKAVTFTPRLLLVDLKGSLKYLPEEGNLYTDNTLNLENVPEWNVDNIEVMKSEEIPVPEYQKILIENGKAENLQGELKSTISSWPDFMYTRYHPRSINVIKNYEYHDDISSLDTFTAGLELWNGAFFEDDFCDKIRNYVEECNNCQGFQSLFDTTDGFCGLNVKLMEHVEDEYSKALIALPLIPPKIKNFQFADEAMSESIRIMNIAFSYAKLSEHSSLFIPLSTMERGWRTISNPRSFPNISFDNASLYHTSAILATFFDTMSLQYRLKDPCVDRFLGSFCAELNVYNRKMCGAKMAFPFPMNEKEDLIDFLDRFEGELMQNLSPCTSIGENRIIQSVTLRGIDENRLKRPIKSARNQMKMSAYKCTSVSEMLQLYCQCNFHGSLTHASAFDTRMNILAPFPKEFFDAKLTKDGFLKEFSDDLIEGKKI
jgi:Tubulin domain/Misato Segment II tubulin-like domain